MNRLPRPHVLTFLFYLGVAMFITWPLATVFSTRLIGHPFSDSYEYIHHIWWIKHALQTGQSPFFQPLLAYPDGLPGAMVWSEPLQSFPAWLFAFFMPLPSAYNLQTLLTLALNGWAMYWLLWKLTGQRGAGLLAGVVFMAYPTFQGQLAAGHIGLLVLWPVPLYFYVLLRIRETSQWRWIALGALLFVLSLLGGLLLLLYILLPLTGLLILSLLIERNWAWLRRVLLVVMLGGLMSLAFILPFLVETLAAPSRLRESGEVYFSADLLTLVTPSFQHPLFGRLEHTHRILGEDPFEKPGYVGIVAGLLAAVAIWRERLARWWLALAVMAWILSLGPLLKFMGQPVQVNTGDYQSFVPLPWAALHNLPILNLTRTPVRFNFTVALVVAVMAGYGAAHLWNKLPLPMKWGGGRGVGIRRNLSLYFFAFPLLIGTILWEYQLFWENGMPTIPGVVPEPVAALAERDDLRAVLDLPWEHRLTDKDAMFLQIGHQQPLIAGHVVRQTPVDPAKLWLLQATLDPALLDAAGVDIIILHKRWDDEAGVLEAFVRQQLGEPFYEDEFIAAFEAPDSETEPAFTTLVTDEIENRAESYFYAPESGWVTLSGAMETNGRNVTLLVDDVLIHQWTSNAPTNSIPIHVPLWVEAGYHTVTLAAQPECPEYRDATLRCRAVHFDGSMDDFTPDAGDAPIQLSRGVQLAGTQLRQMDGQLSLALGWRFDQPLTGFDVRFVHVVDEGGQLVAQDDASLGERPAGTQWVEWVDIALPDDLASGAYTVYAGWYTNPDLTRFAVLSDAPGAADGLIFVGTFELP